MVRISAFNREQRRIEKECKTTTILQELASSKPRHFYRDDSTEHVSRDDIFDVVF